MADRSSIGVVTVGAGGNGYLTTTLQTIAPADDGDRIDAQFVNGKLWVQNSIYLPGEAHCCNTHVVARQFGFRNRRLRLERTATVRGRRHARRDPRSVASGRALP